MCFKTKRVIIAYIMTETIKKGGLWIAKSVQKSIQDVYELEMEFISGIRPLWNENIKVTVKRATRIVNNSVSKYFLRTSSYMQIERPVALRSGRRYFLEPDISKKLSNISTPKPIRSVVRLKRVRF